MCSTRQKVLPVSSPVINTVQDRREKEYTLSIANNMRSTSLFIIPLLTSVLFANRVTAFTFRNTRVTVPTASSTVFSSSYLDRLSKPSNGNNVVKDTTSESTRATVPAASSAVASSSYLDRLSTTSNSPPAASSTVVSSSYLDRLSKPSATVPSASSTAVSSSYLDRLVKPSNGKEIVKDTRSESSRVVNPSASSTVVSSSHLDSLSKPSFPTTDPSLSYKEQKIVEDNKFETLEAEKALDQTKAALQQGQQEQGNPFMEKATAAGIGLALLAAVALDLYFASKGQ